MRIKSYFYVWALLLVGLCIALCFLPPEKPLLHLYVLTGFILLILCYLLVFYNKIVKPMNTIGNGMELLREQDFSSRLGPVKQYEADRIVNIFNRMMDQLKQERLRLREQNHFLDLLIKASPMGVIITDFTDEVSQLNPMAIKMLGVSESQTMGKLLSDIPSPLARELALLKPDMTTVVRLNDANIYKCTRSSFVDCGFPHPFYLIERMTDELMRAERKAYEKVIRMIAHEVNNTTAGITSTLDTVHQALEEEPEMGDICEVMRVCIERCFSMSHFITRFADVVKIPEPKVSDHNLNEVVMNCARFMDGMCEEHRVKLHIACDKEVKDVKIDETLFEQVLVNIIKNAVESIAERVKLDPGMPGEIWVRTEAPSVVEVVDNGGGITPEVESKLFSPFFSTKPNGQGIGLVFIREVLTRHKCIFSLRTCEDGLTRFRIQF